MLKKSYIAYFIFTIALFYIISPWFFARYLLFNEILALSGFGILVYKRFRTGNDPVSICLILLLVWGAVHSITSLFRFDSVYYYLRNLVIVYSMMAFFIGFYCLKYLPRFIEKVRRFLRVYVGFFLFIRLPRFLFERFGMAMLFPSLVKDPAKKWVPYFLVMVNIIYGIIYGSLTALTIAAFYILLFISPGIRFFKQVLLLLLICFTIMFIYLQPNLSLIKYNYSYGTYIAITNVMHSNPILNFDGNSTWRLVLWKEIIVDDFPANIFGLGFGTPALQYYPVEDMSKLPTLPYVLGSHNSFVYLFGRLGIVFVMIIIPVYVVIFREYFHFKSLYYSNKQILIFWSFFAASVIASFNPVLESPIYASAYWLILGLTARCIYNRRAAALIPGAA